MNSIEGGYRNVGANEIHPDKKACEDALFEALNPKICDPEIVEKDGNQESPQGPEVGFINPNTIIDQEKSLSERLQGSARKAAKVMMLVTALSALPGFQNDAQAHEYGANNDSLRTEYIDNKNSQGSEKLKLTKASKWAGEKVKSAHNDLKHIWTAQDAEWLVRIHMDGFADDFYSPPRGASGRYIYNAPDRVYTIDDAKYAIECARTLKGIMEDLHGRYGVVNYEKRQARLDAVISNLEQQTSYSFQKEQEAYRELMKRHRFHYR